MATRKHTIDPTDPKCERHPKARVLPNGNCTHAECRDERHRERASAQTRARLSQGRLPAFDLPRHVDDEPANGEAIGHVVNRGHRGAA